MLGLLLLCPSAMQISLTDNREHSSIDLSALLAAGFQMLTITLSAEQPNVRHRRLWLRWYLDLVCCSGRRINAC